MPPQLRRLLSNATMRQRSSTTAHQHRIPLINFNRDASDVIPLVKSSLSDTGFVYLQNTPIEADHISKVLSASGSFFIDCDPQIKHSVNAYDTAFRGYYLYEAGCADDTIECFSIGREMDDPSVLRQEYFERQGLPESVWKRYISRTNQWPNEWDQCTHFKSVLLEYYDLCCRTSMEMLSFIANSLELDGDHFYRFHDLFDCTLEIKYYPPFSDENPTESRLKEHADQTSVTLLVQDVEGGLQIWDDANQCWFDGITMGGMDQANILCNTGDFMEMWTNGRYKSTKHRVAAKRKLIFDQKDSGRISVVFFCFPNHDAKIETISSCVDAAKGETVTRTICGDELPFVF